MPPHPMFSWPNRTHCCRFPFRKSFAFLFNPCPIPTKCINLSQQYSVDLFISSKYFPGLPILKVLYFLPSPHIRHLYAAASCFSVMQHFFSTHCKNNLLPILFVIPRPLQLHLEKADYYITAQYLYMIGAHRRTFRSLHHSTLFLPVCLFTGARQTPAVRHF